MPRNPNVQRLNRGNLPASQQVHMGRVLGPAVPASAPAPTAATAMAPDPKAAEREQQLRQLEAKANSMAKELSGLREVVKHIGPPDSTPDALLQHLKQRDASLETQHKELLQRTAEVETLNKKVNDLEEQLTAAPKPLDTAKPLDTVWVTAIQSRTNDNGSVVVACTMHSGVESEAVSGTIRIPQSEIGKLKPPPKQ